MIDVHISTVIIIDYYCLPLTVVIKETSVIIAVTIAFHENGCSSIFVLRSFY